MDGKDKKKDKKLKKKDRKDKEIEAAMEAEAGGGEVQQIEGTETEVLEAEAKSILLHLLSQVRIGMDLSRVTLPTFILEPKSFLEKLTDFFTHPDVMLSSVECQSPVERLVAITRWYLSGFYIRPKGVKKPYNPILGEIFRCQWDHGNSKSFYVSEQVSHHPPVSAFYASNRAVGLAINGFVNFRSKFMGNSSAAIMDGEATLYFLRLPGESYTITFPTAYARGILWGTLLMEMGGTVYITCDKTGLQSEIEFKTKPYFGGGYNYVAGKIKETSGKKKTLYTISGKWDDQIFIKPHDTKKEDVLWDPKNAPPKVTMDIRALDQQDDLESRRLWQHVSAALRKNDQETATTEKCKIEDAQREAVRKRDEEKVTYETKFFDRDENGGWVYKYKNLEPFPLDELDEWEEYEENCVIGARKK
jgi:hypothetical protein